MSELRFDAAFPIEFDDDGGPELVIRGKAIPFYDPKDPGSEHRNEDGIYVRFDADVAREAVKAGPIRLLYGHEKNKILARSPGTMQFHEKPDGIYVEARLNDTTHGRDVATMIRRGDVGGLSIGMSGSARRHLRFKREGSKIVSTFSRMPIHEVSVVGKPAFASTNVGFDSEGLGDLAALAELAERAEAASRRLSELTG